MKKIILIIFAMAMTLAASAQINVCLNMKDGSKILKMISDIDSITFDVKAEDLVKVTATDAFRIHPTYAKTNIEAKGELSGISTIGVVYAESLDDLDNDKAKEFVNDNGVSQQVCLMSGLELGKTYYFRGFVVYNGIRVYSATKSFSTPTTNYPAAQAVDLGLSVKWSSYNLGALFPDEYGIYTGWGDPTGALRSNSPSDYAVGNTNDNIAGSEYDTAFSFWGDKWRMPTKAEFEELNTLDWQYTENYDNTGVTGWIVSAKNGNSIFIPWAGFKNQESDVYVGNDCFLWTSERSGETNAFYANIKVQNSVDFRNVIKSVWMPIRPVYDDAVGPGPSPVDEREVDLGLSVKWANCNIGATKSSEAGDYFAWGETSPKANYDESTYTYFDLINEGHIAGSQYDAAHVQWGGDWRMPTKWEYEELLRECTRMVTTVDGVKGCKFTGKNGNSIFMPFAGYKNQTDVFFAGTLGEYYTDYVFVPLDDRSAAYTLMMNSNDDIYQIAHKTRSFGLPIRAVKSK